MNKRKKYIYKVDHERLVPKEVPFLNRKMLKDHYLRYEFAKDYVRNKTVLDVACGVGYGSEMLALSGARKVVGVDVSKKAIQYAKKNYQNKNVTFINCDACKLPFKDGVFDVIITFETIEHLKNPKAYINEITRVLKHEGLLILSSPNGKYKKVFSNPHHVNEFSVSSVRKMLGASYFKYKYYGQQKVSEKYLNLVQILLSVIANKKIKWFVRSLLLYFYRDSEIFEINKLEKINPLIYIILAVKI